MSLEIHFPEEVIVGAHRVKLVTDVDKAHHELIAGATQEVASNTNFSAGLSNELRMDVFSWQATDSGLYLHTEGSLVVWRALSRIPSATIPMLRPAILLAQKYNASITRVEIESKQVKTLGHDADCPWPIANRFGDAATISFEGDVTVSQLAVLANAVQQMVRISNHTDYSRPAAFLENRAIQLAASTPRALLAEIIYIWWQVCWVDIQAVIFDDETI
jgi:hypothetical protein